MSETPKNEEVSPKLETPTAENNATVEKNSTETTEKKTTAPAAKQKKVETEEKKDNSKAKTTEKKTTDAKEEKKVKKVKKTPSISTNYQDVAAQTKTVLRQWANNNPLFDCPLVPYRTLQSESAKFEALLRTRTNQNSDKRGNTNTLTDVNKQIDAAVSIFRRYLKAEYPTVKNFAQQYQYYGFVLNEKSVYVFPKDNDQRSTALDIMVSRLSEANNVFANRDFGLSHWTQLKRNHNQTWDTSDDLRSSRASIVSDTTKQYRLLKDYLQDLHDYVKLFYRRQDFKAALRSFGFMKETI